MWFYNGNVFDETMIGDSVGFVYLITNKTNGRMYVGKKLFTKSKTFQKNKKKKRTRVASDWMDYTGSNGALNEDVAKGHEVHKEILHLCSSKGWMSYLETQEILNRNCLIGDQFYNEWVSAKIRKSHLRGKKNGTDTRLV